MNTTNNLLGSTAHWTASVRAMESRREDRLFNDPWAAELAGQDGAAWVEHRSADSVIPMVIRTRFFDDFLERITQQEKVQQVVVVAAGLDTRAFRLNWPAQTRLFELDQRPVLEYKERILHLAGGKPGCERQVIGADLTLPWSERLITSGFEPDRPSVWLLEGILFYLANETITQLLDTVTHLATLRSWLGFDIVNSAVFTSPLTRKWVNMQAEAGAPWIGTMDNPAEFLAERGWKSDITQAGAQDANYDRWPFPVIPTMMPGMPHNWYVTAQKVS